MVSKMPSLYAGADLFKAVMGKLNDGDQDSFWKQTADSIDLEEDVKAAYERHLITSRIDSEGNYIVSCLRRL